MTGGQPPIGYGGDYGGGGYGDDSYEPERSPASAAPDWSSCSPS